MASQPKLRSDARVVGGPSSRIEVADQTLSLDHVTAFVAENLDGFTGPEEIIRRARDRGVALSEAEVVIALDRLGRVGVLDAAGPRTFNEPGAPASAASQHAATKIGTRRGHLSAVPTPPDPVDIFAEGTIVESEALDALDGLEQPSSAPPPPPPSPPTPAGSGGLAPAAALRIDDEDEQDYQLDDDDEATEVRMDWVGLATASTRSGSVEVDFGADAPEFLAAPQLDDSMGWNAEKRRLFNAALALYKQGLVLESKRYLTALLEVDPHNREAETMLAILEREAKKRGTSTLEDLQREMVEELEQEEEEEEEEEDDDDDDDDDEDDEHALAAARQAAAMRRPPPRSRLRRWGKRLIVLGVIGAAMALIPWPLTAKHEATLVPHERRVVRAGVDGLAKKIHKKEGQRVKKGALVVELDDATVRQELEKVKADVAKVAAELRILKRGATPEERRAARGKVAAKAVAVRLKAQECRRKRKLVRQGVAPRDDLLRCLADRKNLSAALAEERAALGVIYRKATKSEVSRVDAQRDRLLAQRKLLQVQLEATRVISPISGVIVTPKLEEKTGVRLSRGDEVFEVANDSTMAVEIHVAQEDMDIIAVGLPVALKVPSMPAETFVGKVTNIGAKVQVDTKTGKRYVIVTSLIKNDKGLLRHNMTGVAEVRAGYRSLAYHAGRRIIRWVRLNFVL